MTEEEFQMALQDRAHVHIGKQGITQGMLDHIQAQFKLHRILKIKIMKEVAHAYGPDYFIRYLIEQLGVYVLDLRGFTFLISKRKPKAIKIPKKYWIMRTEISGDSDHTTGQKFTGAPLAQTSPAGEAAPSQSVQPRLDALGDTEPEYIDYDDEELVKEIDQASDIVYGDADGSPVSLYQISPAIRKQKEKDAKATKPKSPKKSAPTRRPSKGQGKSKGSTGRKRDSRFQGRSKGSGRGKRPSYGRRPNRSRPPQKRS